MNLAFPAHMPPHDGTNGTSATADNHEVPSGQIAGPIKPFINTAVAMTVTPASATGATSAASSARSSPSMQKSMLRHRQPSLRDLTQDRDALSQANPAMSPFAPSVRPFHDRSHSPHTRTTAQNSMAEAISAGRSPGLIRRMSRGASSRLRRRASTTHNLRMRDQSAGPVLMRRRSDSNGASDADQDISDCEPLPPTKETEVSPISRSDGLGISLPRPSNASSVLSGFEGGIAPAIHAVLEQGTWCDKISTKKTKRIKIWLDTNAARVCWHPTNSAKSFFIDDVREIRVGADARNARDDAQVQPEDENRMISIIYQGLTRSKGSHMKYMHLRTPDAYITNLWVEALDQ
ncbi:hypothetical protein LTR95_018976, partial [Oleoguttula sp. CCFEE 5521]